MKQIIEESGKTLKEFAEFYEIPYNTVRQWYNEERNAPSWVKNLIEKTANGIQLKIPMKEYYYVAINWCNCETYDIEATFKNEKERDCYAEYWKRQFPNSKIIKKTLIEK